MSRLNRDLARFLLVGASNTLLSFTVFRLGLELLPRFGGRAAAVQAVAYAAGMAWSFVWNRSWTFRSEAPVAGSLARFGSLQLALLGASSLLLGATVDGLGWAPTPTWVVVMGLVTVANFALQRRWVFSGARPRPHRRRSENGTKKKRVWIASASHPTSGAAARSSGAIIDPTRTITPAGTTR